MTRSHAALIRSFHRFASLFTLAACTAFGTACVAQVDVEDSEETIDCEPGAFQSCRMYVPESAQFVDGNQSCFLDDNGLPAWTECASNSSGSTPLVLSFDRTAVQFTAGMNGSFDLAGREMSVATDWPTSATPWLAFDRNGNGRIDGGSELFGSAVRLADGAFASNGFLALRELDSNGDGRITPSDAAWHQILVWTDLDGDRASTASELSAISEAKLLSIELDYASAPRCDTRGNCEIERTTFRYLAADGTERTGDVIDVHLSFQ